MQRMISGIFAGRDGREELNGCVYNCREMTYSVVYNYEEGIQKLTDHGCDVSIVFNISATKRTCASTRDPRNLLSLCRSVKL